MGARMVKARCRYCGTRVEYFGDVCAGCEPTPEVDGLLELTRADLARLAARGEE